MARTRVSTTVDDHLLQQARQLLAGANDASVLDQALEAMIVAHRRAEIDAEYAGYDVEPDHTPDEWGDLASFRNAAGR
jgi:hypothetical protein